MHAKVRSIIIWALVAFAIYAIVTSPQETANVFTSIWKVLSSAVMSIGTFFNSLLSSANGG